MNYRELIAKLRSLANPENVKGMARYGISAKGTLGISMIKIREIGKEIGVDHKLALKIWQAGIHEARILASIIDDPKQVNKKQMESWAKDFDSWDVCDQVCTNLFDKTPLAFEMVRKWAKDKREFVKRSAFSVIAGLSLQDVDATDRELAQFFPIIKKASTDERNFVRKAVNWALRNLGKRNPRLNKLAIKTAREIQKIDSKAARWIAADALRELTSEKIQKRIAKRAVQS